MGSARALGSSRLCVVGTRASFAPNESEWWTDTLLTRGNSRRTSICLQLHVKAPISSTSTNNREGNRKVSSSFLIVFRQRHNHSPSLCLFYSHISNSMLFQRFSVLFLAGLSYFSGVVVVAQDPAMDMQVGMEGLMRAAKDPAMMAQLMQDMQVRMQSMD